MRFTSALAALLCVSTALALPKGRKETTAAIRRDDDKEVPVCKGDENEDLVQAGKVTAVGSLEYYCVNGQPEVSKPALWTGLSCQGPQNLWNLVHDVVRGGPSKANGIEAVSVVETDKETTITFTNLLNGTQTGEFEIEKLCTSPQTEDGPVLTQYRVTDTKNSTTSPFGNSKIVTQYLRNLHKEASNTEVVCEVIDKGVEAAGVKGVAGLIGRVPMQAGSTVEFIFWEPKDGESHEEEKHEKEGKEEESKGDDNKDDEENADEEKDEDKKDGRKPGLRLI
ncbi:hypothetical protein HK097_007219 [Rhizophlyctis rosea]|uniref:Uncharacterized protein n=1 Tax=Rhizophlyctis rosea TaxID=64517 RepID=A0AAD5SBX6_9FUNG|nr:hypothetical protein HK097_007219 [Rhizophlyctis rosea]